MALTVEFGQECKRFTNTFGGALLPLILTRSLKMFEPFEQNEAELNHLLDRMEDRSLNDYLDSLENPFEGEEEL